ncbi:MAG: hypothetical protein IPM89_12285 [Candidatus Competibacteraceae bacterium]|nr:MAG: hypothetical protein IPM89_12285 [Candidatus Competibacteraceae bacterium]
MSWSRKVVIGGEWLIQVEVWRDFTLRQVRCRLLGALDRRIDLNSIAIRRFDRVSSSVPWRLWFFLMKRPDCLIFAAKIALFCHFSRVLAEIAFFFCFSGYPSGRFGAE